MGIADAKVGLSTVCLWRAPCSSKLSSHTALEALLSVIYPVGLSSHGGRDGTPLSVPARLCIPMPVVRAAAPFLPTFHYQWDKVLALWLVNP